MAKYHRCQQYSDEYDNLRRGLPTSSRFDKIITPTGKASTSWQDYAFQLVAERLSHEPDDQYASMWMDRGLEIEPEAVEAYELINEVNTETIGFVTNNEGTIGCSPDRLIGNIGLLEIKSPKAATVLKYRHKKEIDAKYKPQLQGQLYVTEREWVDIFAYHPDIYPCCIRVERDDSYIKKMAGLLDDFVSFIAEIYEKENKLLIK